MRSIGILALVGAFVLIVSTPDAQARGGRHPHFDDRGTLTWYHSLAEAQAAARRENKLILVEFGRLRCSQCRVFCNSILPHPRVRQRVAGLAVGLAADCDRPEPVVDAMLRRNLPYANMLPFVAFLTADGEFITGYGGSTSADRFLVHVRKAESRRSAPNTPCAPCAAPQPARPRQAPCEAPSPTRERPSAPASPVRPLPAPAPRVATTPPSRPARAPAPILAGSPDAVVEAPALPAPYVSVEGCGVPPRRAPRTHPLPAPRIVISPPITVARGTPGSVRAQPVARLAPSAARGGRSSSGSSAARRAHEAARRAADRDQWADVLALAEGAPEDPALQGLVDRANRWAHDRLATAALDVREGRYQDGLAAVEAVLVQMGGQPVAVDANRGLGAIQTLVELRFLNPEGAVAKTVRKNARDEYRGTRWASLF